jgi:hypothetical protein
VGSGCDTTVVVEDVVEEAMIWTSMLECCFLLKGGDPGNGKSIF